MDKEKELRKLLDKERIRCNTWRQNYQSLKDSHLNLQANYLASRSEQKKVLEHTKQIIESKDEELQILKGQLDEKMKQVEFYLNELKDKEKFEECFKEKCKQEFDEYSLKMKKDFEYLKMDKMKLINENGILKQKIEHLEQEIEIKLANLVLEHQNEINALTKMNEELRVKFRDAKKHPDYEKLIKLTNENQELKEQLNNQHVLIEDADEKYKKIDDEREKLINGLKSKLKNLESKFANAEQENAKQKQENLEFKNELINLENQLKNLKNTLQDEQRTKDGLMQQHSIELKRKQKENDDLKQLLNEEKHKFELEFDKLKQEKKKFKNDYEDAKDEMRKLENSIEQREKDYSKELSKAIQIEKDKYHNLLKEKQNLVIEKEEIEDNLRQLKDDLNLKQKQFDEISNGKHDLEKEVKQLKAQISTFKLTDGELKKDHDKLKKDYDVLNEDFKQLKNQNSDLTLFTKQLSRENVNLKEQFTMFRNDVEEERKQFDVFKKNSERDFSRTKNSFELQLVAHREEIEELKDAIRDEKRKRADIKSKCVQYCEVAKKLHKHLKQFENEDRSKMLFRSTTGRPAIKDSKETVRQTESDEIKTNLKKQYKEMKKMLNEIQNSNYCKVHEPIN